VVVLLVGRQTYNLQVAGLSPGWATLLSGLGQATYHISSNRSRRLVLEQYCQTPPSFYYRPGLYLRPSFY